MLLSESNKKRLQELAGVVKKERNLSRNISESSKSIKYKKEDNLEEISINDITLPKDYIHDHLNEKIWTKDGELDLEILEKLEEIAKDFHEYLDVKAPIKDIWFTGSLANYNWTDVSDIDLHILIDYKDIDEDEDFVRDYLASKKTIWNEKHDIRIKGFEVELYAQDSDEFHRASGVYSIQNEEWVRKPSLEKPEIDKDAIKDKIKSIVDKIEVVESIDEPEKTYKKAEKLKDKLKKMRQSGLEKTGEFSSENLAFKYLRNNGYIERLFNIITNSYDKSMSINEIDEEKTATYEYDEEKNYVLSDEVWSIVNSLHTDEDDLNDGDLKERVFKFPFYELTEIPMSTLDTDEFLTNPEVVDDYVEKTKINPDYPPIIFDPEQSSIIDGMHRVQALEELGYDEVRAYVGVRNTKKTEEPSINEGVRAFIKKDLNEFFSSKGFHASIDDWLNKWRKKGVDVGEINYGDGVDMEVPQRESLLSENNEMFYKSPIQHKLFLEKNINDEHNKNMKTVKDFILLCCKENNIDEPTKVYLRGTRNGSALKTTASYNTMNHDVHIYCKGRHVVDIMRSIAHELMHMRQNLDNRLHDKSGDDGSEHENEAHSFAGLMIRKFGKEKPSIYENYKNKKGRLL